MSNPCDADQPADQPAPVPSFRIVSSSAGRRLVLCAGATPSERDAAMTIAREMGLEFCIDNEALREGLR